MELQTANFYIFIWLAYIAVSAFILRRAYKKGRAKAEAEEDDYYMLEDSRFLWRMGIIVGLVILYAVVLPFRSDIDNYDGNVSFVNDFKEVTEDDRVRAGLDLSDEAREADLAKIRLQNEKISEDIAEESDVDDTNQKGDNQ